MSRKKDIGVFGDPSYLVRKFDDVDSAVRSDRSKLARKLKAIVDNKATKKDNMQCHGVILTKGVHDGAPCRVTMVHVGLGLNGPGKNSDYLVALKRLTDTRRFTVVDAWIDAVDDLWDVLLRWEEA